MKPSLSLSPTAIPMKRRSKARSEAKSLLGSGFKAKKSLLGSGFKAKSFPGSESGSSHRMNPAQPQKLQVPKMKRRKRVKVAHKVYMFKIWTGTVDNLVVLPAY